MSAWCRARMLRAQRVRPRSVRVMDEKEFDWTAQSSELTLFLMD